MTPNILKFECGRSIRRLREYIHTPTTIRKLSIVSGHLVAVLVIVSVLTVPLGSATASATEPTPELIGQDRADVALSSGDTFWQGQTIGLEIPASAVDADAFELRAYDESNDRVGQFVREFTLDENDQYELETNSLEGSYVIVPAGERSSIVEFGSDGVATGTASDGEPFEVNVQTLSVGWETDRITTSDEDVALEIESNRARYNVNVSADGLEYGDLEAMFRGSGDQRETNDPRADRLPFASGHSTYDAYADDDVIVLRGFSDRALSADFRAVDPGDYSFVLEVTDTGVTSTAGTDNGDEEGQAVFELSDLEPASVALEPGDPFNVSATVTNTGNATGIQDVAYQFNGTTVDSQELTLEESASATTTFNTTAPDEAGTYSYGFMTDVGTLEGAMTVEEVADDSLEEDIEDDVSDVPDENQTDDSMDDDQPGFGLLLALGALIGVILAIVGRHALTSPA